MIKRDKQGRITEISRDHPNITNCHSVCNVCGKDMPICWDIVCYVCNRTFCYEHAKDIDNYWYCPECAKGKMNIIQRITRLIKISPKNRVPLVILILIMFLAALPMAFLTVYHFMQK